MASYEKAYNYPYAGWGARESGQAKNWLKSCPLEKALTLCRFYPHWKADLQCVRAAHPFGMLVQRWVSLYAWVQDEHGQRYREFYARVEDRINYKSAEENINVRRIAEQERSADEAGTSIGYEVQSEAIAGILSKCRELDGSDGESHGS